MKKKKIIIFGKKSLIGSNLYNFLKKKHLVKIKNFNIRNLRDINSFNYIINCSTNLKYVYSKYDVNNDFDIKIINKIKNPKTKYIFLQTRKIYKPKPNIKENSAKLCKENYEKNKLITEKKIIKNLKQQAIILRIANIIGLNSFNSKKIHKTYIDHFLMNISKNKLVDNKKRFKDFIDIGFFSKIIQEIIEKDIIGVYNISIGEKILLNNLNNWLLTYYKGKKKLTIINDSIYKDEVSFFLNNSKIKKHLKFNYNKKNLKEECIKMSKKLFKK